MKRVLLVVVALILYGSFYPWQFHNRQFVASPLWMLAESWPSTVDRFVFRDIVVNVALYVPFGVSFFLSLGASRRTWVRAALTLAAGATFSTAIELVQLFDQGRVSSSLDVACNTSGAAMGILLATTFPQMISGAVSGVAGALGVSGPLALLYIWAGYELFPFFPALTHSSLEPKLRVLFAAGAWPLRDLLEGFGAWFAVFILLEFLTDSRKALQLAAGGVLLIPMKLLLVRRTMTASEFAGAMAAMAVWLVVQRFRWRRPISAALAASALLAGQLLPWSFAAEPQAFTWIPFGPSLSSSWDSAFLILLRKAFLFGSAIWLWRQTKTGWLRSSLYIAIPLAITEGLQVYLPGRTPEITDAVLGLIMGFALWRLERRDAGPGLGTQP